MKKIAVITSGYLPMPAVKGGAVENLIQIYLDKNEIVPDFDYDVFSIYDESAEILASNYHHVNYIYIKPKDLRYKRLDFYNRVVQSIWYRFKILISYRGDSYIRACINKIKKSRIQYDAIIIENVPLYSIYLKKYLKTVVIQHLHNDMVCDTAFSAKRIIKTSDLFWTVSNFIKERVSTVSNIQNIDSKIKVLYNGIETGRFQQAITVEEKQKLRESIGIKDSDSIVLFVGRIHPTKGVKELLQAFAALPNKYNLKLVILGASFFSVDVKTPYIKELENVAFSIKNNVLFTGYIDYSQIHKYYQIADITVLPSMWDDPFPLTCLEALATGCPLIITNSGGMVEAVNEDCAIIIKRDENIIQNLTKEMRFLLNNKILCQEMKEAAFQRSQCFTDDIFYQNFLALLMSGVRKQ